MTGRDMVRRTQNAVLAGCYELPMTCEFERPTQTLLADDGCDSRADGACRKPITLEDYLHVSEQAGVFG